MGRDKNDRRAKEGRHVRLYTTMMNSPAWRDLSGNAVKGLIYLATWEDGRNNGELFMSERMLGEGAGFSRRTAHKVFDELEDHGFIAPTAKGHFVVKRGPATCWRLTWLSWPGASRGPTNEYRNWKPPEEKSRVQKLHATDAKIAPVSTARLTTDAEIAPVEAVSPNLMGAKSSPHTIAIGETPAGGVGWWHANRASGPLVAYLAVMGEAAGARETNVLPFKKSAAEIRADEREPEALAK